MKKLSLFFISFFLAFCAIAQTPNYVGNSTNINIVRSDIFRMGHMKNNMALDSGLQLNAIGQLVQYKKVGYSLPISTVSVLGGVKPDNVHTFVNGSTGVITVSGFGTGTFNSFTFQNSTGITGTNSGTATDYILNLVADKTFVGLNNVDNTSDISKPVSTAVQTALNLKADLNSPAFTGNPTAPTQTPGNNSTRVATTAYVDAAVAASVTGVSQFNTRTGNVVPLSADYSAFYPLLDGTGATGSSWNISILGNAATVTNGVYTSSTYSNPSWFLSLDWSKLLSVPTTLSGYGITDPVVLTSGSYSNPSWITALSWAKITGHPTTLGGYGITDPVVLTSSTYANPSWITSLIWSKITSTPTSLAGYGITDPIVLTSNSYSNPTWVTALAWAKITGTPNTLSGYGISDAVNLTGAGANGTWNISITGNAGTVTTNANLTGDVTSVGNAATLTNSAVIGQVLTGYVSGAGSISSSDNLLQAIQKLNGNQSLYAPLASPALTGNPTAPTPSPGDNTTKVATTAFVSAAVAAATTGVSSFKGRTGAVVPTSGDYTFAQISTTPTSLAGYGITDPIVLTSGSYANPAWVTALAWSKITGAPTTFTGYGITGGSISTLTVTGLSNIARTTNVVLQTDTIPLMTFGAGGANAGDTSSFTTTTIYGSVYNSGTDTLVITSINVVLQGSSSPTVTVDFVYNTSLNVVGTHVVTGGTVCNNTTTGTNITTFTNSKIPPGNFIWCKTTAVTAGSKPNYMGATVTGYKMRKG